MAVKMLGKSKKKKNIKRRKRSTKAQLELPMEKSTPSDNLLDYSILIYGRKKIGKTTLAAQFEDAFFLMCEPGGRALSLRQVSVRNWQDFKEYVDLVIEDKEARTIVVDTADFCYEYCMEYVCEKLAIDHPSDEDYGKGWNVIRKEFTKVISKLLHSEKGIVFISHSKDSEFKTRKSEGRSKVVSSMPGQAKDVLEGLIDIWVCMEYDGKRRTLIISGNDEVDAGHRLERRFKYSNGDPIETISMGQSSKEGYKNFIEAFENNTPNEKKKKSKNKLVLK